MAEWVIPDEFDRVLARKPTRVQIQFFKALQRMDTDLGHTSLKVGKLQGPGDRWYARASRSDRITFLRDGNRIILLMNCGHEIL